MANLLDRIVDKYLEKRAERLRLPGGVVVPRQQQEDTLGMTLSAVWAAITLLSGHLSSVPLNLYRRLPGGGKERATDHPLWRTLHDEPAPGISSVEFREALVANIELFGVGYVQMAPIGSRRLSLRPFNSLHVTPDAAKKVFHIANGKMRYDVPASAMIVFPTLTLDGDNPIRVTSQRKRSLSLAISYEQRAEAFNKNGSIPAGVAIWGEGYNRLSPEQKDRLEAKWQELYQGVSVSGGTAFMPHGSDFKALSFNPEMLQMLGSREFSIQEIARWFGIKPH
jgi:HK97 family phage portal protein